MAREHACRKCKSLSSGKVCPVCGSTDLSSEWSGLIVILDPEKSEVAKTLDISKSGRYALRVS
ncbi:MAG: transcription elongation factor subunit Spt4 [Nitrososphaerales archaeon]